MRLKLPKLPNIKINQKLKNTLTRKAPEILTFVGTAGMFMGAVLAVSATPKACRLIEEKKEEKGEDLTPVEVVKTTWKCYIPSTSVMVLSAVCVCSGNKIHVKRQAALATACSISTKALTDYKEKVKEVVGEKKAKTIQDAVAAEQVKMNPVSNNEVIITKNDSYLCYDSASGRYFKSDIETIKRAVNELNRNLMSEMYISLNDYYMMIGLPPIAIGDELGWNVNSNGLVDISFSSTIADNGIPCLVCNTDIGPRWDFREFM